MTVTVARRHLLSLIPLTSRIQPTDIISLIRHTQKKHTTAAKTFGSLVAWWWYLKGYKHSSIFLAKLFTVAPSAKKMQVCLFKHIPVASFWADIDFAWLSFHKSIHQLWQDPSRWVQQQCSEEEARAPCRSCTPRRLAGRDGNRELQGLSRGSVKVTSHGMAYFPACIGRGVCFYSCYHTAMVAPL